jgi:hypothetical protein
MRDKQLKEDRTIFLTFFTRYTQKEKTKREVRKGYIPAVLRGEGGLDHEMISNSLKKKN